ncbi:class I SAM-dependent methyltransferase [Methylobacterium sp. A52T]
MIYNNDLKDSQRFWTLKTILATQPVGSTLLEIGAGEPIVADLLGRLGYRVIIVDPYEGAGNGPKEIDHFRRTYKSVEYVVDWFSTDLVAIAPGSIDCCYSISVIEHVPLSSLQDIAQALRYFTKPDGSTIHAVDYVALGAGAEYHWTMYQTFSALLGYTEEAATRSIQSARVDPDTYYLSAEAHNRWRGTTPYENFPMRRVQSMQVVGWRGSQTN